LSPNSAGLIKECRLAADAWGAKGVPPPLTVSVAMGWGSKLKAAAAAAGKGCGDEGLCNIARDADGTDIVAAATPFADKAAAALLPAGGGGGKGRGLLGGDRTVSLAAGSDELAPASGCGGWIGIGAGGPFCTYLTPSGLTTLATGDDMKRSPMSGCDVSLNFFLIFSHWSFKSKAFLKIS
jgi:hypothetical protein